MYIVINIKNKNNVYLDNSVFESIDEANIWIESCKIKNLYGKSAGFYTVFELNKDELAQEISRKIENDITLIEIPDQVIFELVDLTEKIEEEKNEYKYKNKYNFCLEIINKINIIISKKKYTEEQYDLFYSSEIMNLMNILSIGNLEYFLIKFQAINLSQFFTNEEKNSIVNNSNKYLEDKDKKDK
jgi:hypothetical protein